MTNAQLVLEKIKSTLCHEGTTYKGNSGTYMFVEGKTTAEGTINGVVKKLDEQGAAKTAGSFKILEDGTVLRFTGIATKTTNSITKEIKDQTTVSTQKQKQKLKHKQKQLQSKLKELRIANVKKIILTAESEWAQQFWKKTLAALQHNN